MAERERADEPAQESGKLTRQRGDLDAILKRISEHIADIDRRQGQAGSPSQSTDGGIEAEAGPAEGKTPAAEGAGVRRERTRARAVVADPEAEVEQGRAGTLAGGEALAAKAEQVSKASADRDKSQTLRKPTAPVVESDLAATVPEHPFAKEPVASRVTVNPAEPVDGGESVTESTMNSPAHLESDAADTSRLTSQSGHDDANFDAINAAADAAQEDEFDDGFDDTDDTDEAWLNPPKREPAAVRAGAEGNEPPALRSALRAAVGLPSGAEMQRDSLPGSAPKAGATAKVGPERQPATVARDTSASKSGSTEKAVQAAKAAAAYKAAGEVGKSANPDAAPLPAGEPWDVDAAEALTRVYEDEAKSAAEQPPLRSMLELMQQAEPNSGARGAAAGQAIAKTAQTVAVPAMTLATTATSHGASRIASEASSAMTDRHVGQRETQEIAETRLLEAAERVEMALDRLASKAAVDSLGNRFDTLEAHVADASSKLGRLDTFESQLGELGTKLTDDAIVRLFGPLVPTAEDLSQLAEDAAMRAADRVLETFSREMHASGAGDAPAAASSTVQLDALGTLLGQFMADRQRTDASTHEALETLQLAMQHLLDRIDGMDEALPEDVPAPAGAGLPAAALASAAPLAEAASSSQASVGDVSQAGQSVAPGRKDGAAERGASSPHDLDTVPDAGGYDEAQPAGGRDPDVPTQEQQSSGRRAQEAQSAVDHVETRPHNRVDAPPAPPVISGRQAMIETARKAAERAKAEAQAASEAQPAKRSLRGSVKGAAPTSLLSAVRPGVLVLTSLAALLLAGYWMVAGSKNRLFGSASPSAIERAAPPAATLPAAQPTVDKTTRPGSQPDIDTSAGRGAIPVPVVPPTVRPDKTSNGMAPLGSGAPLQEASAASAEPTFDGPGIAIAPSPRPLTAYDVMKAQQQARLAKLSQRAAYNAAARQVTSNVTSVADAGQSVAITTGTNSAPAASTTVELPPAMVGPLSLRLAAAKGDPSAQFAVATRFAEGQGVEKNFVVAATWYQRAAMQGLAIAQYRLATLYEHGTGVKADAGRARVWYGRAADQGNLRAMHNLAVMSTSAANGTPDYDKAAKLFVTAAERGLMDSQYNLAVLHESGLGVSKNLTSAYKWYSLAAKAGDRDAARRRDQIISRLSPSAIQAGNRMVATWRRKPSDRQANDPRVAAGAWKQRSAAVSQ